MTTLLKLLAFSALAAGSYLIGKALLEMEKTRLDPHLGYINPRRAAALGFRQDEQRAAWGEETRQEATK